MLNFVYCEWENGYRTETMIKILNALDDTNIQLVDVE